MSNDATINTADEEGSEASSEFIYSADRGRGILTPSDREFLLGGKTDYQQQSVEQKRRRIRGRIENALLDFSLLFEDIETRDREQLFDPDDDLRAAYTEGITNALAFLYLGAKRYPVGFRELLANGVKESEQELTDSDYRVVRVEFDVEELGGIDVDAVIDALESGDYDELTGEELRTFVLLLGETDAFAATAMREELKDQISELTNRMSETTDRKGWVEELSN